MRIAFTGSANVGKTTLFNALKNELKDYSFYPELALQLIKEEPDLFLNKKEFEKRLYGLHRLRETNADFKAKNNIIVDRCILDTIVFSKYCHIKEYLDREHIIKEITDARYDMIFIVFPFEPFREADKLHIMFIEEAVKLSQRGIPFALVEQDDLAGRVDLILSYIENFNQKPLECGV
jgi:nicotinamide riboside kinase